VAVRQRLFRLSGYDWMISDRHQHHSPRLRAGDLTWTVEEVTPNAIQLRLEGFSQVGSSAEDVRKCSCKNPGGCEHWGCDLHYLGSVTIDRAKKTIVAFRLVGRGDTFTRLNRKTAAMDTTVHTLPTGVVFELASDCSANRHGWPPLAVERYGKVYWNLGAGE
jgi:hypothetical protein